MKREKDKWDQLSLQNKALIMRMAVQSGITDIHNIRKRYNSFARGGYTKWKEKIKEHKGIDIDNDPTYDYEGFYNSDPDRAWDMMNKGNDAHFIDEYKTVLHPSFSNQSIYSGHVNKFNPKGIVGGTWIDDNHYQLSQSQFDNDWDTDATFNYFDMAESSPMYIYAPDGSTMLRGVTVTPQSIALNRSRRAKSPNLIFSTAQDTTGTQQFGATYLAGVPLIGTDPHTCLNTVTSFYDPENTVASNPNMVAHPEDYGYRKIPQSEVVPGDLITLSNGEGHPNFAYGSRVNKFDGTGRSSRIIRRQRPIEDTSVRTDNIKTNVAIPLSLTSLYPTEKPSSINKNSNVKKWQDEPEKTIKKGQTYVVKSGDYLGKIAQQYNTTVDSLKKLNQISNTNLIYPGQILNINKGIIAKDINIRKEREREADFNKQNITAIQNYRHSDNYIIADKKNRTLTIYDKNNNPLYVTRDFATGASGDDYNTITQVDSKGDIKNKVGNNSTPAGILEISGINTYHGYPSFTRARVNKDGTRENTASSLHWGRVGSDRNVSNGCFRIGGKTLCDIEPLITIGTRMYTLPEKEGSRFTIQGGKLNFTADNPYGISLETNTETIEDRRRQYQEHYPDNWKEKYKEKFKISYEESLERAKAAEYKDKEAYKKKYGKNWEQQYNEDYKKRFWDDYNISIDRSYSPLKIKFIKTGNKEYDTNRQNYAQSLVNNKKRIQQKLGLTSSEYDNLAELALGIAEQESKFGTSKRYKVKQALGEAAVSIAKGAQSESIVMPERWGNSVPGLWDLSRAYIAGNKKAQSRGFTQIKTKGDNKELRELYKELGITNVNILEADKSALATIIRLAYMYNTEVRGRKFEGKNNIEVSPQDALLYKWNAHGNRLKNKTATPEKNIYVQNVHRFAENFGLYRPQVFTEETKNLMVEGGLLEGEDERYLSTGNEYADIGLSFVPFIGGAMDIEEAVRNPTFGNIAWAAISTASDIFGGFLIKGALKSAKVAHKAQKAIKAEEKATRAYNRAVHNATVNGGTRLNRTAGKKFRDMRAAQAARRAVAPTRRGREVYNRKPHTYIDMPSDNTRIINPVTVYGTDALLNGIQQSQ